jgi:hypothetical protein
VKVALLSTHDASGGAARGAFRLLQGLKRSGADARMYVQEKTSGTESVFGPDSMLRLGLAAGRPALEKLALRLRRASPRALFTGGFVSSRVDRRLADFAPDLIHLHWVGRGFLAVSDLRRFGRPLSPAAATTTWVATRTGIDAAAAPSSVRRESATCRAGYGSANGASGPISI